MSRVRFGQTEWRDAPRPICLFCFEPVAAGAAWFGAVEVAACSLCVREGKLGLLLGDASENSADVTRFLEATGREAWRALALAREREDRRG